MSRRDERAGWGRRWLADALMAGATNTAAVGTAEARPRPKPANAPEWARVQGGDGYYSATRSTVAWRFHGGVLRWINK